MNSKMRRFIAIVGVSLGLLLPLNRAFAKNPNPRVLPPHSSAYGQTYGEWSAAWWQFVFSIPAPDNPLFFDDKCEVGQSGKVWFLTGKFCVNQEECGTFLDVTRHCTIPSGTALFFPIANSEWDNLGVDPPLSLEELRAKAKESQDAVTSMTCEVDGRPIQSLNPAVSSPYSVLSPVFDYTIPDNNLYQFLGLPHGPQTVEGAVADGVFLMLAPLSVGHHTIHFTASFNFGFAFDMTYEIDVVPGS